jgi:hypothetical protein
MHELRYATFYDAIDAASNIRAGPHKMARNTKNGGPFPGSPVLAELLGACRSRNGAVGAT